MLTYATPFSFLKGSEGVDASEILHQGGGNVFFYLENKLLLISINWKPLKPATVGPKNNGTLCFPGMYIYIYKYIHIL